MLNQLRIQNFAIISELELDLSHGFSVLTGETGAGKSIVVDAIGLLLGNSGSEEWIRSGADSAVIEGHFVISYVSEEWAPWIESDRQVVVLRKLVRGKPSVTRVNGQTISLKQLKMMMKSLIGITGQHDQMGLLDPSVQLAIIDSFLDDEATVRRKALSTIVSEWKSLSRELKELQESDLQADQKIEFLRFQIADIESFDFKLNEEDELIQIKKAHAHSGLIQSQADMAMGAMDAIQTDVYRLDGALKKLKSIDSYFEDMANGVSDIAVTIADYSAKLADYVTSVSGGEHRDIDAIEGRLDVIFKVKHKYKVQSLDALNDVLVRAKSELAMLTDRDEMVSEVTAKRDAVFAAVENESRWIHSHRVATSEMLRSRVEQRLVELGFMHAMVDIRVEWNGHAITESGASVVSIFISPNPGDKPKPIEKIASGGELSRIMLAFNSVFFEKHPTDTLIFDEVDTGVGGLTALKIGELLKLTAAKAQVIVVTHLPQIAQMADHHFLIEKSVLDGATHTSVSPISDDRRTDELKRMVGGEVVVERILR